MRFRILDILLPREIAFFRLMDRQVGVLCSAARDLRDLASRLEALDPDLIHERVSAIKDLELQGDRLERFIIDELDRTFITPIDREDIHTIVTSVDRTLDLIHETAEKMEMYGVRKVPEGFVTFTGIIVGMSQELRSLMSAMSAHKDRRSIAGKMHLLENQADHLFRTSLAGLFAQRKPIEIIKFKDLYENCESVVNSMDHIAKLIRGIMVKQG